MIPLSPEERLARKKAAQRIFFKPTERFCKRLSDHTA